MLKIQTKKKSRYKIAKCSESSWKNGEPFKGFPPVEDCNLVLYLVLQTSFADILITMSQFKARKGLEAYNQFVCRWTGRMDEEVDTRRGHI